MQFEPILTQFLAAGTVLGLVGLGVFWGVCLASRLLRRDLWQSAFFADLVKIAERYGLLFAFLITGSATVLSLYYSDVVGWVPCTLCWYQRIFIYSSALLLGLAWWRGDRSVYRYVGPLLLVGATFAVYHYLYQTFSFIPSICPTSAVSCQQDYIDVFGFVTIPLMSLVGSLLAWIFVEFARDGKRPWWRWS